MSVRLKPPKIQLLSEQTINQIAAGEVIENPASVLKELVENALDAGAQKILIETKGGGLQLIRVSDDGFGMSLDDAKHCFLRFATSKIQCLEDLSRISTMGFRGEALAAISSISKVSLRTCDEVGDGVAIEVEAGKILSIEKCARSRGTTLEVRSLFYNVPARKKFQKSAVACAAELTRMTSLLALAHPSVHFELMQQEKTVLSTGQSSFPEKIREVLGEDFLDQATEVKFSEEGFEVWGFVGDPQKSRPNRSGQYLFINNRPVSCPLISYAVKDGFGTRIASDRFPTFVLHLRLSAQDVDVNVHPQKKEVRISDEQFVREKMHQAIFSSLNQKMEPFFSTPSFSFTPFTQPKTYEEVDWICAENSVIQELNITAKNDLQVWGILSPYLFFEDEEKILVIDLHAAHSRLLYDSLLHESKNAASSQGLLIPVTVTFSRAEFLRIEGRIDELEKMGISLRGLQGHSFIVNALPPLLMEEKIKDFLLLFAEDQPNQKEEREKRTARMISQITLGKKFTMQEGLSLYEEFLKGECLDVCPQGKPIKKWITAHEISRLFKAP
jgi:DNA mismatch repair protein MutL